MHPSCRSLPEAQPTTTFVACEGYPRTGPAGSMRPLRVSKTLASVTSSGSSGGHHELVPRTGLVGGLRLPASMRELCAEVGDGLTGRRRRIVGVFEPPLLQ